MLTSDNKIIIAARNYTCQIACAIIDNVYFYTADYYKHEIFLRIFYSFGLTQLIKFGMNNNSALRSIEQ